MARQRKYKEVRRSFFFSVSLFFEAKPASFTSVVQPQGKTSGQLRSEFRVAGGAHRGGIGAER